MESDMAHKPLIKSIPVSSESDNRDVSSEQREQGDKAKEEGEPMGKWAKASRSSQRWPSTPAAFFHALRMIRFDAYAVKEVMNDGPAARSFVVRMTK